MSNGTIPLTSCEKDIYVNYALYAVPKQLIHIVMPS